MGQFSMKICPQVDQFLMELNKIELEQSTSLRNISALG